MSRKSMSNRARKKRQHKKLADQKAVKKQAVHNVEEPAEQTSEVIEEEDEEIQIKKPHPGSENLIPFSKRTEEERRAIARAGGKASGEARRKRRDLVDQLNTLLAAPASDKDKKQISKAMGVDESEIDSQQAVISVAMISEARKGNVKAFEAIAKVTTTDSETDREMVKLRREELKMKRERHEAEMQEIRERHASEQNGRGYHGIPVMSISPNFAPTVRDIILHAHVEYIFPGGRGSTKSSLISIAIIDLIMHIPGINALSMRKVGDTLRGSVYNQILWAISELNLENEFICTVSPLEITRKSTKQKIFFRGLDDFGKIKSIKPLVGYIGILWFEELDQYNGEEEIRKVEQSAMRGGDKAWVFKSFNPPRSKLSWANKYVMQPKDNALVIPSDYRSVPPEWLGQNWLDEAELLKKNNPAAYENEYLGVANGNGGNVFENVTIREITDEEIEQFDRIYNGVDWGWYPDPFDYVRVYYNHAQMRIFIYAEYRANKMSNLDTAQVLKDQFNVGDEIVTCDSADPKSVSDYRTYGIAARGAEKGPGSVEYSMKWLASRAEIVIDPKRCPYAAEEFSVYEFMRDKEGNVVSGYPDSNNHSIDAVRYALNPVWKRRGN